MSTLNSCPLAGIVGMALTGKYVYGHGTQGGNMADNATEQTTDDEQTAPVADPATGTDGNAVTEPAEPTPSKDGMFTQEQVNDIVAQRVAREDAKYADYDELKAKAAQADALQQKLDEMTAETERQKLVAQIANEKGVPAALLQNAGDTPEAITAAADALVAWKGEQTSAPQLPAVGGDPTSQPPTNDWVSQLFAAM